eukprot:TRINITY_DN765_c0_g1_i2.p1 TRINITY_DN765_c0_g1~~TRINITY_DN765_c0_g1_i2.p1  ORF type:complete len:497 (-),score=81.84 TRINITY_DN765_c0_g1_i2:656-2146(-)
MAAAVAAGGVRCTGEVVCPEAEARAGCTAARPYNPGETMWDLWHNSAAAYAPRDCFGKRRVEAPNKYGAYEWASYEQVNTEVEKLAAAFVKAGLKPHESVAVFAQNCPESVITMNAVYRQNMVLVPLYATFGMEAVAFIIEQAETSTIICDPASFQKLADYMQTHPCPHCRRIIVTGSTVPSEIANVECFAWDSFFEPSKGWQVEPALATPDDLCTIFYTSGTTGMPKGVMLTNRNLVYATYAIATSGQFAVLQTEHPTHISYLPLAHVYECTFMNAILRTGGRVGFFSGSIIHLFDDIEALEPDFVIGVPRVWKKFYDKVMQTVNESGFIPRTIFSWAQYYKTQARLGGYATWVDWDALVFNKIKAKFGRNIKVIVSAAAPIDPQLLDWLRTCVGVNVYQGYGMTESAGGVMIQSVAIPCPSESVGYPVVGIRIRLMDVPEMNYLSTDKPPRGEIQMQGPSIFTGYFKEEEMTKETLLPGGWLATGREKAQHPTP